MLLWKNAAKEVSGISKDASYRSHHLCGTVLGALIRYGIYLKSAPSSCRGRYLGTRECLKCHSEKIHSFEGFLFSAESANTHGRALKNHLNIAVSLLGADFEGNSLSIQAR